MSVPSVPCVAETSPTRPNCSQERWVSRLMRRMLSMVSPKNSTRRVCDRPGSPSSVWVFAYSDITSGKLAGHVDLLDGFKAIIHQPSRHLSRIDILIDMQIEATLF